MHDHQKLANVSGAVQSLVISAAVVIGGIWAFSEFIIFRKAEHASTTIVALQKQVEESELQSRVLRAALDTRPNVQIDLDTSQHPGVSPGTFSLGVAVTLKNIGLRDTTLDLVCEDPSGRKGCHAPLVVRRVGKALELPRDFSNLPFPAIGSRATTATVRAGGTQTLYYLVSDLPRGLYWVSFVVDVAKDDLPSGREAARVVDGATLSTLQWTAGRLVDVGM